jgi:plasmid replication initiation protein
MNSKELKKPDPGLAAQSHKLIEASYKMSVPAKRVMLMLLGQIHPGQQDVSKKIKIHASDYSERTGITIKQSYADIKNGCDELMKTIITTRHQKEKSTEKCVVVSWMKYHDYEGWLEATFTPWIAPYIHSLHRLGYKTIAIDEAVKFKRFYTIRLYELLMQFDSTGNRYIKLESLREIFQIEKSKYPKFAAFRKWVLEPSIFEINEKTKWVVSWEPKKTGKKVTSISFSFSKSPQKHLDQDRCPQTQDMFEDAL